MEFKAETVTLNGAKLALRRAGAGEPVIFLHGADGLTEWPALLDDLAANYDVIVPDLPGFGQLQRPNGSMTFPMWLTCCSICSTCSI